MVNSAELNSLFTPRFAKNFFPIPPTNSLQIGSLAPPFELIDVMAGQRVKLADYLSNPAHRFVLLAFTRIFSEQHYCPFCYPHIKDLNQAVDQFKQRGVALVVITSTDPQQSQVVQQDLGLKMPLLSDPECKVFRQYQLGQALGAPLPAQFLIDRQGKIRFKHLFSFIETNASVERLLGAVDANSR